MRRLLLLLLLAVPAMAAPYTKNVAVVIYEGVEILDFGGPAEVFSAAANFGANGSERAFNVYTVSRTKAPVVSQGFIDVTPDYSIDDAPKPDIIVLPGGNSQNVIADAAWLEWVRKSGTDAENILTVCTGAFIAGKAGFLENAEATTFYRALPGLEREFPNTRVRPGTRFVDNGKIITTAGVSAGIDGSLHLVARLLGRWVADRTAEYMEYKWSPESLHASKYALLNPQLDARGRQLQEAAIERDANPAAAIAIYRALLAGDAHDAQTSLELGRVLHAQKRLLRGHRGVPGCLEGIRATPHRPLQHLLRARPPRAERQGHRCRGARHRCRSAEPQSVSG